MIILFLLSLFIIEAAHGAMEYKAEHGELKQLNLDSTLMATFKWSDGYQTKVQMFAPSPQHLQDCIYRGSFQEDRFSSILGFYKTD